MIEVAARAT